MKGFFIIIYISLVCLPSVFVSAQGDTKMKNSRANSVNASASKLSEKLEKDESGEAVADDYVELANNLSAENEYAKAETYLEKAIQIYTKQKLKEKASVAYRELAKVQEVLQKNSLAIENYNLAAQFTSNVTLKEVNLNDANRLSNMTDLNQQSIYIQQNLDLLNTTATNKERVVARKQMAQVKIEMNDPDGAIDQLEEALTDLESEPQSQPESFKVKQLLANALVTNKRYEDAIELNHELIAEAQKTKNPSLEITQMQELGQVYFEAENPERGYDALMSAYQLAIDEGRTLAAKKVMEQLVDHYQKERNYTQAIQLYADFINRLDTLVKNDSTLIDAKFFQFQEDKINQLEKERQLKDELIDRKNKYNYVLIASILVILIILMILIRILVSNIRKNKKIALQSLRREMNPHFIFNSLNSVNQFIAQNNELEANKYLTSYSRLMRNIMENSNKDFIPLNVELDQLKEYLELEHQRFFDKFDYRMDIDEHLDTEHTLVPNMLIQPQLENAIWHGLRYKQDGKGLLILSIRPVNGILEVTIDDNGIGREQSQALKTAHQKKRQSRGITNTLERIELLNKLYRIKITMRVDDKKKPMTGVVVILSFPWMDKNSIKKK